MGWEVRLIDTGEMKGFSLVNPEGAIFHTSLYSYDKSPGEYYLLQEGRARLSKAEQNRWIAETEQALWEKRRKAERLIRSEEAI